MNKNNEFTRVLLVGSGLLLVITILSEAHIVYFLIKFLDYSLKIFPCTYYGLMPAN